MLVPRHTKAKAADPEQDGKRDEQEHDSDCRGAFGILGDPVEEEDRGDLGLERKIARDEDDLPAWIRIPRGIHRLDAGHCRQSVCLMNSGAKV